MIVTNQQQDLLSTDLELTPVIRENLLNTAKWGKFIAIAGFACCGLTILTGVAISMKTSNYAAVSSNTTFIAVFFYIVFAVIMFFPCLYLFRFSQKIKEAYDSLSQEGLESAISNLKSLFNFTGVVTILMLFFWALAFLGILLATYN